MNIHSQVAIMVESNNGPEFISVDCLTGDYCAISSPVDWADILRVAAVNSGVDVDVSDIDDWQWFELIALDQQGFRTFQDETVAVYVPDSSWSKYK